MPGSRRRFLKDLGIAGALTAAPGWTAGREAFSAPDSPGSFESGKLYTVEILQTTDVHCQLHPHDELFWEDQQAVFRTTGGYARLATLLRQARSRNPDTFIVDTGDMFQGSELSVKTMGKALVPILNQLGYDLFLPGNWEVVYGKKPMQTLMGALAAPKVCANMYHDLGDGKRGELIFLPYHVWSVRGVKIGFLGYTDPMVPLRQSPNYSKGIIYSKPEENLAHYVSVLRDDEACDFVIILAHLGLSQQIHLANHPDCRGVDYILGGDTHERVRKPIQCAHARVVEPGAFGSFVGKLELTIRDGKIIGDRYELLEVDADRLKVDKATQALIDASESPFVDDMHKVVGYSTIPLYRYFVVENPIDTLVLDALDWRMETDIVLSNGFRFCPPRTTPDKTGNIPVTEGYIYDMLPVDSVVRKAKVTGKQLQEWLEKELNNVFAKDPAERFGGWVVKFKGMHVEFNAFGEKGRRVQKVMIGGQPLDPARTYTACACERDGDPFDMLCRIKGVQDPESTTYTLHGVMKDYLRANSPVTPSPQGNAVILDGPATLLTQVTGVEYQFR